MDEVSGPVVAIGLVLCAVFVPVSFMGGIVGQLYRQFALTLSVSGAALGPGGADPDAGPVPADPPAAQGDPRPGRRPVCGLQPVFDKITGGYRPRRGHSSCGGWRSAWRVPGPALGRAAGWREFLPTGFVPNEDQGYFFAVFTLPDGASMERTEALVKGRERTSGRCPAWRGAHPGRLNLLTNAYTSNNASFIVMLKPWEERKAPRSSSGAAAHGRLQKKFAAYPEAVSLVFSPPPITGLGNAGGFAFELQDRRAGHPRTWSTATRSSCSGMASAPEITGIYSGFRTTVPQINWTSTGTRPSPEHSHQQRLPGPADLSGRPAGERLQSVRPHLQGDAPGGAGFPGDAREHQRHLRALRRRRHGADLHRQPDRA